MHHTGFKSRLICIPCGKNDSRRRIISFHQLLCEFQMVLCTVQCRSQPMVPGSLYLLRRKCGKPNCRCATGELHTRWVLTRSEQGSVLHLRKGSYVYAALEVVPGNAHEGPILYRLVEQFVDAVGKGVMKLLILDRGFIDGERISSLQARAGAQSFRWGVGIRRQFGRFRR